MTKAVIERIADAGREKADLSRAHPSRYLTRAALAGAFIFVGTLLSALCLGWLLDDLPAAKLLSALAFSAALILVVLLGGELFTGCNMVLSVALLEKRARLSDALRVWAMAYAGNLVGIVILSLLVAGSGASHDVLAAALAACVPGKLSPPWYTLLLKGVLCNFLVCLGVFAGFRLQGEGAKALVIALVITPFVLCGFEHSIANMAYFSLYALLVPGADLPAMGHNLLWVTLGNFLGGGLLLGWPLWRSAEA